MTCNVFGWTLNLALLNPRPGWRALATSRFLAGFGERKGTEGKKGDAGKWDMRTGKERG